MSILLEELSGRRSRTGGRRRRGRRDRGALFVHARLSEQRSERMHRVGALILLALVLAGVAWLLLAGTRYVGRALFTENRLFTLRHYDLRSDGRIEPHHIREYASLPDRANLFGLDIQRVRADLASVPLVKSVTVTRRLPDTLVVRVTERTPLARVALAGAAFSLAVDAEGRVLGPSLSREPLPLIEGARQPGLRPGAQVTEPGTLDALALLDICDRTRLCQYVHVQRIRIGQDDRMGVTLAGGEQVVMPRKNLEPKLRKLAAILKTIRDRHLARQPSNIRIDMTTDANFPVAGLDV